MTIPNSTLRKELIIEGVRIIDNHLNLLISKYRLNSKMSKEDIQDMRSECILQIIKVIDNKFEIERGYKLITYILPRVKGFFKDYLKKESRLKTHITEYILSNFEHQLTEFDFSNDEKTLTYCIGTVNLSIPDDLKSSLLIEALPELSELKRYVIISYYILENDLKELSVDLGFSSDSGWLYKIKNQALVLLNKKIQEKLEGVNNGDQIRPENN